jgi:hypothetical protein
MIPVVGAEVEQAVVVNHGEAQVPQPALPTEQVARQARLFRKIDRALKNQVAGLERDLVAECFE